MFDDLVGELLRSILGPMLSGLGTQAIGNAIWGQGGLNGRGGGSEMPPPSMPTGGAAGAGTQSRPTSLNFTGGFTGAPPGGGIGAGGAEGGTSKGFTSTGAGLRPRTGFESV